MLGEILRKGRLDKGFKTLELARLTKIDGALISKFESGKRMPTLAQLQLFSQTYDLNFDRLKVQWIKEKILTDFENDTNLLQAISTILAENKYVLPAGNEPKIDLILEEGLQVNLVVFPEGNDPDSFVRKIGSEAFLDYIKKEAKDVISFQANLFMKEAGDDPFKKSESTN